MGVGMRLLGKEWHGSDQLGQGQGVEWVAAWQAG